MPTLYYNQTLSEVAAESLDYMLAHRHAPYWVAIFKKNSWAPGLWAGTEGHVLTFGTVKYRIAAIDYHEEKLILERL